MKQSTVSKKALKSAFSRASSTYDDFSIVQRQVNRHLLELVPDKGFDDALEIGCGTGAFTRMLIDKVDIRRLLAIDISFNMLLQAKKALAHSSSECTFLCCDGERLGLKRDKRFHLIVSSSCMHWFEDFGASILNMVSNHLRPEGYMVCSVFGSSTLIELKEVLKELYPQREFMLPPSEFPTRNEVESILSGRVRSMETEEITIKREYKDLLELLLSLKRTGTTARSKKGVLLYPRGKIAEAESLYREIHGKIRASFQVIFFKVLR